MVYYCKQKVLYNYKTMSLGKSTQGVNAAINSSSSPRKNCIDHDLVIQMNEKIILPMIAWIFISTIYIVFKCIFLVIIAKDTAFSYNSYDIRIYFFGCGLVNFINGFTINQWLAPNVQYFLLTRFPHLQPTIPYSVWFFACIYFGLSLFGCDSQLKIYSDSYFTSAWIFIIVSNAAGGILFLFHPTLDKYAVIPINDMCKVVCVSLICAYI